MIDQVTVTLSQGSPKGQSSNPHLFTIFIDDLDDYAELIDMLAKYADDSQGLQEIKGIEDRTLHRLMDWAKDWGMEFNVDKCKIMHVGRNNPQFEYSMGGTTLRAVEEEKDIGVTIHNSLKPSRHCKKIADTANAVLRQLTRNFHFRDRHIFKKLYTQYVRPHVEFASPAWSPWNEADKEIIEKVQMKAVKMISGLSGSSYKEKCLELGLETLEERRKQQDLLQTYKICNGKDRVRPEILFKKIGDHPERNTRYTSDPLNITGSRARLDIRKNSYAVRAVTDWNNLTNEAKSSRSVAVFKNAIKSHPGRQVAGPRR